MTDLNIEKIKDDYKAETRSTLVFPYGNKNIPLFLEFLLTITRLVVIVITVLVAILSIMVKASLVDIAVRVGISILVLGLLGILINWLVGRRYISSALLEMNEIGNKSQENESSFQIDT